MAILFKKIAYNCGEATLLSLKRKEDKISVLEKLKLWYHLKHCGPCQRFMDQWKVLGEIAGRMRERKTNEQSFRLSDEQKAILQKRIDESR
jgi:hypothetical protein